MELIPAGTPFLNGPAQTWVNQLRGWLNQIWARFDDVYQEVEWDSYAAATPPNPPYLDQEAYAININGPVTNTHNWSVANQQWDKIFDQESRHVGIIGTGFQPEKAVTFSTDFYLESMQACADSSTSNQTLTLVVNGVATSFTASLPGPQGPGASGPLVSIAPLNGNSPYLIPAGTPILYNSDNTSGAQSTALKFFGKLARV